MRDRPRILAVATAVPPHRLAQSDVRNWARRSFADHAGDIERLLPAYDNAGIEVRYSCVPLSWYDDDHGWRDKNELYLGNARELTEAAATRCLQQGGVDAADIGAVVCVSTSGIATPSLDARLISRLGLGPEVQRMPLFGLGCAGGVLGLARAAELATARPGRPVLLLVAELCGLTFRRADLSKSNVIATALFGDGALTNLPGGIEQYLRRRREIGSTAARPKKSSASEADSVDVGATASAVTTPTVSARCWDSNPAETYPVRVIVSQTASPSSTPYVDLSPISIGDTFVVDGDAPGCSQYLKSTTGYWIKDAATNDLVQDGYFHTSCSQPVNLGDQFGAFQVFALETTQGGTVSLEHEVEYTYEVTNPNATDATSVSVDDDQLGNIVSGASVGAGRLRGRGLSCGPNERVLGSKPCAP